MEVQAHTLEERKNAIKYLCEFLDRFIIQLHFK
jgi:hypothetical protein